MPTLFTALQAHVAKPKPRKVPRQTVPPGRGLLAEISATGGPAAALKVKAAARPQKRTRPKDPRPHLSLRDRFEVVKRAGPRGHVIVVGGGFAGLSAAYELKSVGYRVTVVEARKTVGGRIESRRDVVPGMVMEGGAELIGRNHLAWWSYKRIFDLKFEKLQDSKNPPPVILGGCCSVQQRQLNLLVKCREASA